MKAFINIVLFQLQIVWYIPMLYSIYMYMYLFYQTSLYIDLS